MSIALVTEALSSFTAPPLKQRYRIIHQVGRGGMGAVYKAEDTLFRNRLVAVKEMSQHELKTQQEIYVLLAKSRKTRLYYGNTNNTYLFNLMRRHHET